MLGELELLLLLLWDALVIAELFEDIVVLPSVLDCCCCGCGWVVEFVMVWKFPLTVDVVDVDTPVTFTLYHLIKLLVVLLTFIELVLLFPSNRHDNLPASLFCPSLMAEYLVERV